MKEAHRTAVGRHVGARARCAVAGVGLCLLGVPVIVDAAGSSPDYSVEADCLFSGGRAVGGDYRADGSVGEIGGHAAGGVDVARKGYVGQLYDVTGLQLAASPSSVDEGATRQVTVARQLDDGSVLVGMPVGTAWGTHGWPLHDVNASGLVTASLVYADMTGLVWAVQQSATGTMDLLVLNVGDDDFGIYAGDELPDDWQVRFFGVGNTNAFPTSDRDGDGRDNAYEHGTGTDPTNGASFFALWIEIPPSTATNSMDVVFAPCFSDRTYTVGYRTNLGGSGWSNLVGYVLSEDGAERTARDTNAVREVKYYCVHVSTP